MQPIPKGPLCLVYANAFFRKAALSRRKLLAILFFPFLFSFFFFCKISIFFVDFPATKTTTRRRHGRVSPFCSKNYLTRALKAIPYLVYARARFSIAMHVLHMMSRMLNSFVLSMQCNATLQRIAFKVPLRCEYSQQSMAKNKRGFFYAPDTDKAFMAFVVGRRK